MKIFVESMLKKQEDEFLLEKLMPKNWLLSDYSLPENLIEIEEQADGCKYWFPTAMFFGMNVSIGETFYLGCHGANLYTGKGLIDLVLVGLQRP